MLNKLQRYKSHCANEKLIGVLVGLSPCSELVRVLDNTSNEEVNALFSDGSAITLFIRVTVQFQEELELRTKWRPILMVKKGRV